MGPVPIPGLHSMPARIVEPTSSLRVGQTATEIQSRQGTHLSGALIRSDPYITFLTSMMGWKKL